MKFRTAQGNLLCGRAGKRPRFTKKIPRVGARALQSKNRMRKKTDFRKSYQL